MDRTFRSVLDSALARSSDLAGDGMAGVLTGITVASSMVAVPMLSTATHSMTATHISTEAIVAVRGLRAATGHSADTVVLPVDSVAALRDVLAQAARSHQRRGPGNEERLVELPAAVASNADFQLAVDPVSAAEAAGTLAVADTVEEVGAASPCCC